ncbi:MAG: chemotaxis protein CheW [Anaerofustis sp.]
MNEQWDSIKLFSEINCPIQSKDILPHMQKIQNSFFDLQSELIETLEVENLKKLEQKIVSKAQVAVDILIRNLYERTADVGFLATDDEVRRFAGGTSELDSPNAIAEIGNEQSGLIASRYEERTKLLKRLNEYVAKYSVYEEIIILDNSNRVLINLDQDSPIEGLRMTDPLLEETLHSTDGFVETFRKSELQPHKAVSHIFSSKIADGETGSVLGIICLCFRFENEMERIFEKLDIDYDGSVIAIVDRSHSVIASSDENHLPIGIKAEAVSPDENGVVYYRGNEYIARTVATKGYQGYFGLGWKGHIMIPLRFAFLEKNEGLFDASDQKMTDGLMQKANSFSKALHEIVRKTQEINSSLRRIVFNGEILMKEDRADGESLRLKPILRTVSQMGEDTSQLFETSVRDLFSTVISASMRDVGFLASLCTDIMDRNLYERANDCRWWALNTTFRKILAKQQLTERDTAKLTDILVYINSLYTVYSNLFLFDAAGMIVAVSNPSHRSDIGKKVEKKFVRDVLINANEANYFVSDFEASDLYDGRHTYIYGASVTDFENNALTVGGIGIVFDSDFQFRTMLHDALSLKKDSFAVFTDRKGVVISSTREDIRPGTKLKLPASMLITQNGMNGMNILVYEESYFAVGSSCSSSYREYKNTDGYRNDVLAFVFEKLADYEQTEAVLGGAQWIEQSDVGLTDHNHSLKLATFRIGEISLALDQKDILEVVDADRIVPLLSANEMIRGAVGYRDEYIAVADLNTVLAESTYSNDASHLLVVRTPLNNLLALAVDELHTVLELDPDAVKRAPKFGGAAGIIKGIVSSGKSDGKFLFVLDSELLFERLDSRQIKQELTDAIGSLDYVLSTGTED